MSFEPVISFLAIIRDVGEVCAYVWDHEDGEEGTV
jgi:hypothetical protein